MSTTVVNRRVEEETKTPLTRREKEQLRRAVQGAWKKLPASAGAPEVESALQEINYGLFQRYRDATLSDESRFRFYRKWRPKTGTKGPAGPLKRRPRRAKRRSKVTMIELVPGDPTSKVPAGFWFECEVNRALAHHVLNLALPRSTGFSPLSSLDERFFIRGRAVRILPPRHPAGAYTIEVRIGSDIETYDILRPELGPTPRAKKSL